MAPNKVDGIPYCQTYIFNHVKTVFSIEPGKSENAEAIPVGLGGLDSDPTSCKMLQIQPGEVSLGQLDCFYMLFLLFHELPGKKWQCTRPLKKIESEVF